MKTLNYLELINRRVSVRKYTTDPLNDEAKTTLEDAVNEINQNHDFSFRLILGDQKVLSNPLISLGRFKNVQNYIAIITKTSSGDLLKGVQEKVGYVCGSLLLLLEDLNLGATFLTLTFKKTEALALKEGETLHGIIIFGIPLEKGELHHSKELDQISDYNVNDPQWYKDGLDGALKAPTALNGQNFEFKRKDNIVQIEDTTLLGNQISIGLVHYFFDVCANSNEYTWENISLTKD